ncbi:MULTISPECIES: hypothetical protein [Aquimarina]|uniref:hypothetical protein n=1 Tax=Aquimarina TaxID=290174 RepID=UPI000CDECFE2|nr:MULTISPECIES: hypothetical protein [Aquimarina]
MTRYTASEAAILEQYRVALQNVKDHPEIAEEMAELNYDDAKIEEGKLLLDQTRTAYDYNKQEDDETLEASAVFKKEKETLELQYRKHRKKAKVVFRKDLETLKKLHLTGSKPKAYNNWIETIRKFYSTTDQETLTQLASLRITTEDITAGIEQIAKVETARTAYLLEIGESQDATKQKDAAFTKMEDWMQEFYAIANIALEDKPQLIEALGRKRKS